MFSDPGRFELIRRGLLYLPLQKANEGSFRAMSRFINVSVYDFADLPH